MASFSPASRSHTRAWRAAGKGLRQAQDWSHLVKARVAAAQLGSGAVLQQTGYGGAVDQRGQAGGEDDAALLPSVSVEPSAAGAEPAGLQSGEFVAAAGVAPRDRELVAHQPAATTGEDLRTAGQTCVLLLAIAGRRTSDAAAVWGDAGSDCSAPHTDRIERWWLV